jgi:hypothetical protein
MKQKKEKKELTYDEATELYKNRLDIILKEYKPIGRTKDNNNFNYDCSLYRSGYN